MNILIELRCIWKAIKDVPYEYGLWKRYYRNKKIVAKKMQEYDAQPALLDAATNDAWNFEDDPAVHFYHKSAKRDIMNMDLSEATRNREAQEEKAKLEEAIKEFEERHK